MSPGMTGSVGMPALRSVRLVTRRATLLKSAPTIMQRILVQHPPARVLVLDHLVEMRQERAVAASHVADAARLQMDRPVEDLDDDFVDPP